MLDDCNWFLVSHRETSCSSPTVPTLELQLLFHVLAEQIKERVTCDQDNQAVRLHRDQWHDEGWKGLRPSNMTVWGSQQILSPLGEIFGSFKAGQKAVKNLELSKGIQPIERHLFTKTFLLREKQQVYGIIAWAAPSTPALLGWLSTG